MRRGGHGIGGRTIVALKQRRRRHSWSRLLRSPLFWLPVFALTVALALGGLRFLVEPTVLRVAVGPEESANVTLMADLARELANSRTRGLKLKLVTTADPE